MSLDCDYLFLWDVFASEDASQQALGVLENIERHIGYKLLGRGVICGPRTLYWSCAKHGLVGADIAFPQQVDQVLRSAMGDPFQDVTEHWRGAARKPL